MQLGQKILPSIVPRFPVSWGEVDNWFGQIQSMGSINKEVHSDDDFEEKLCWNRLDEKKDLIDNLVGWFVDGLVVIIVGESWVMILSENIKEVLIKW